MDDQLIKEFINSKDNDNLVIAWLYLKNCKKWKRGEFRDYIRDLFKSTSQTGKTTYFIFNLQDGDIRMHVHRYTYDGEKVCSIITKLQNRKITDYKKIPIMQMSGAINSQLNKVINFINSLVDRL